MQYYRLPLLHSLPDEAMPPQRRASVRASQASTFLTPIGLPSPSPPTSRPQSIFGSKGLSISTITHAILTPPSEPTTPTLDQPPSGPPILSHKSLTDIFSNLAEIRSLSQVMLEALEKEVPDMPTKPVAVTTSTTPSIWSPIAADTAPFSPDVPGLSSSTGSASSVPGPSTPAQSQEDLSNSAGDATIRKTKRRSTATAPAAPVAVGRALLSVLPFLKSYSVFVANYSRSSALLAALAAGDAPSERDDPARWAEFVQARRKAGLDKGVGLGGLLLNVVQRVPRYRFLLADLLEHTEVDHPDHASLVHAYALADQVAGHLEGQLHNANADARMVALTRAFGARGLQGKVLVVPGRKLIKVGRLRKLDRKGGEQTRTFLLFNDMLMHASQEGDWLGKGDSPVSSGEGVVAGARSGSRSRTNSATDVQGWNELGLEQGQGYICHRMIRLEDVMVVSTDDSGVPGAGGEESARKYSFEILVPEKSFALFAGKQTRHELIAQPGRC